jgi:hypothetical protein
MVGLRVSGINLNIDSTLIDYTVNDPNGVVGKEFRRRGLRATAAAKRQVGVDTGQLKGAIKMTHSRAGQFQRIVIGANVPHARDHHEGTRPHMIEPTGQRLLRFTKGSRVIYTRRVMHPGTRPNRYLTDQIKYFLV